jgi:hypothetical protein
MVLGAVPALPQLATPLVWLMPWPVVPFWPGGAPNTLWASVAKTTPAEESSRHAPMVREAAKCFICTLPFKAMLRSGKIARRVPKDGVKIFVESSAGGDVANNTERGRIIPNAPDLFYDSLRASGRRAAAMSGTKSQSCAR